jgi:hypothetical protein
MAYALSIIDQQTADDLNDIREMRNACAHSFKHVDFATPELRAVCMRLFRPQTGFLLLKDDSPNNLRQNFIAHCMALTVAISHLSRAEARKYMAATIAEFQEADATPPTSPDKSPPPQPKRGRGNQKARKRQRPLAASRA